MSTLRVSRRHFLTATVAAGALGGSLKLDLGAAHAKPAGLETTPVTVDRRTIEVNGKPASVFGIQGPDGHPGLALNPGQRFKVSLDNKAGEQTIVHWHGQTPPASQDGVVQTGYVPLIDPGSSRSYDFAPRTGTHWMHSHQGLQEQVLMAAPLIVRSASDLASDAQEVVVMLHDFMFRDPAEVLAALTTPPKTAQGGMSMSGMSMGGMTMGSGAMGGAAIPKPASNTMDLNDVNYDAYLANDCTLNDPLVIRTERSGRVHLRLINGATTTAFWVELGALEGTVTAVDGDPVRPLKVRHFPIAQAQRFDIIIQLPRSGGSFPILAQREGDRQCAGIILASVGAPVAKLPVLADKPVPPADLSLEKQLVALSPLAPRQPGITHRVTLEGSMQPYAWTINGRTWAHHEPLRVSKGQRVVLEMLNPSTMAHPMHLHGHHFQVIDLNGRALAGAMRDTVLVPARGNVTVAFDADNPGRWLFHCHNLFHMAAGMMTEIVYDNAA